ncbi:SCO6880 family protein [Janibacter melonis]|uniref:SCO6880 family protein n=1 Tax=Janibacter melonis TaxID=262209 RepID=UPI00174BA767|nr:SCO6880 family protein [Janibacter melonis]
MSETEAVKYSNLARPKAPGIGGLSPLQFLTLIGVVLVGMFLMFVVQFWVGMGWLALSLLLIAPWVLGTMALDKNPYGALIRRRRWSVSERAGRTALAQGPTGLLEHGSFALPGLMADSELLEAEDGYGVPFALIHHRGVDHYSVVIETAPEGTVGIDQESIDRKAAHWGTYLGVLSRERDLIGAQVVVETVPDTGLRLERAAMADVDPGAPEFALSVLRDVVGSGTAGAAQINTTVTLTFDARKGVEGAKGARDADTMADDIGTRLPGLIAQLRMTGAGFRLWARTAADIIDDTRVAFDPSVAAAVEQARNAGGTGLAWNDCGPVAAHAGKDYYAHDGSVSMSMMMAEPPRGVFYTLQLRNLLEPNARVARKRVALLYRPLDPTTSANLAEWRVTSASSDASTTRRRGPSERKKQRLAAAQRNAAAEAEGNPFVRVGMIVTATVEDVSDLPAAKQTLLNLAGQAQLKMRPCWGMHDVAFVAALPLGIVLPERVALPGVLRETM